MQKVEVVPGEWEVLRVCCKHLLLFRSGVRSAEINLPVRKCRQMLSRTQQDTTGCLSYLFAVKTLFPELVVTVPPTEKVDNPQQSVQTVDFVLTM